MGLMLKLLVVVIMAGAAQAQELKTRNLIIVTLDGYRWRELFGGADPEILSNPRYVSDTTVRTLFGGREKHAARVALMPFMWSVVAEQGQLYGNREYKSKVNCTNNHLLSYPGYSEMLVGFTERSVSSNDRKVNPNATVLEFIHRHQGFHKKVVAFGTWDMFPYIFREQQANFYVNAGNEGAVGAISVRERKTNAQLENGKRNDEHTFVYAFEYLKREKPRVLFIGFDGTDHHAHAGNYGEYLRAANRIDHMLEQLWSWVQSQPQYRDQTTLLVTTDHGRGNGKHSWRNHRLLARGSRHIWFAVIGPDTPAFGELKFKGKYYQKQVAKTLAAFLGLRYQPRPTTGEIVYTMIAAPGPDDSNPGSSSLKNE